MNQQRIISHSLLMILIAICAWTGILLQFCTHARNMIGNGKTWATTIIQFFSYFTITTNLLISITTTAALLFPNTKFGRWCVQPRTITAITIYIIVVGVIANVLLRSLTNYSGWDSVGNELVHSITPVLYTIYWLAFATKGSITWTSAFSWLIYPFIYFIYSFIRGSVTGWYPYPFIDVSKIGYTNFLLNSFYMLVFFVVLNLVFIGIDKMIAKQRKAAETAR